MKSLTKVFTTKQLKTGQNCKKKNRNKNNLHRPEGINKVRNVCENLLNSRENVEFLHGAACILTQTGKYDPFSGKMQPINTDFRCVIMLH